MLVESRSLLSGIIRTINLPVTENEIEAWETGVQIQEAMPKLTPAQRKFFMTSSFQIDCDEEPYEYYSD